MALTVLSDSDQNLWDRRSSGDFSGDLNFPERRKGGKKLIKTKNIQNSFVLQEVNGEKSSKKKGQKVQISFSEPHISDLGLYSLFPEVFELWAS